MKRWLLAAAIIAAMLTGCAGGSETTGNSPDGQPPSPLGSPFSDKAMGVHDVSGPLLLDRGDLSIGTTVQFNRMPTAVELHDAIGTQGLAHLVLSLPYWPVEVEAMQVLTTVPPEVDVVVVIAGYPPNRAAVQAWDYIKTPLRIIAIVPGPPPSRASIDDFNTMRGLERVIAQMDQPSRWGFEQLQRPLSFRKVMQ